MLEKKIQPLNEIENISQAISNAMFHNSLQDAIGFMCMWEYYRHSCSVSSEPCFGFVVAELLRVYGIDVTKISKRV